MRFKLIAGFAVALFVVSAMAESSDAQLFRRGKLKQRRSCCPAPAPSCCPAPTASCCGVVQTMVANPAPVVTGGPAPVVMNNCCGSTPMVISNPVMTPTPVVDPNKKPVVGRLQDCQDDYNACIANCNKNCTGAQLELCNAYCSCVKSNCENGTLNPCTLPTCAGGGGGIGGSR